MNIADKKTMTGHITRFYALAGLRKTHNNDWVRGDEIKIHRGYIRNHVPELNTIENKNKLYTLIAAQIIELAELGFILHNETNFESDCIHVYFDSAVCPQYMGVITIVENSIHTRVCYAGQYLVDVPKFILKRNNGYLEQLKNAKLARGMILSIICGLLPGPIFDEIESEFIL